MLPYQVKALAFVIFGKNVTNIVLATFSMPGVLYVYTQEPEGT